MPEDLALAWWKAVRDLNREADAAQARLDAEARGEDPYGVRPVPNVRVRPRANRSVISRAHAAMQPRDSRGRWVGLNRWTHGTLNSYAQGKCRCQECVARWNSYFAGVMRVRRARDKAVA